MSKKPIKSSLFRFVTLRSPQALEDTVNRPGLIIADSPVTTASVYYQAVSGVTEGDTAAQETAIRNADSDASFLLIEDKTTAKGIATDLYTFSSWLMRNKNYLTYESVASNMPAGYLEGTNTSVTLTDSQRTRIWDNLIYQTVNRSSTALREALIQMLITNEFVKNFKTFHDTMSAGLGEGEVVVFTDQDEEEFIKRANASVVIAKEVLLSNKTETIVPENTNTSGFRVLENQLLLDTSLETLRTLQNSLAELDREEEVYNIENQIKYDADLAAHQVVVDAELADTNNKTTVTLIDPDTQLSETYETYDSISEFNFTPLQVDFQAATVFNKSAGQDDYLSTETLELLQLKQFDGYNSFDTTRNAIKAAMREEEQKIQKLQADLRPKVVAIGGAQVTLNSESELQPYCFAGQLVRTIDKLNSNRFEIALKIRTGRENANVASFSASLSHADSSTNIILANGLMIDNSTKTLLFKFPMANDSVNQVGTWDFSADLTFANGDIVELRSSLFYTLLMPVGRTRTLYKFNGCGTLTNGTTPTEPVLIPSFNGVTNLGIADFLRVEQEICCYVPGEVSHIENILAREYKEKSTRSLVSSEISTEQTRETEVENLTDTTSTERNELSSEVSSVIDQQNSSNFGANASVNGKIPNTQTFFSAGASFGSSSSSATSNSNSQAQSYAQEVTERALERVVSKTSSKRTSRVLREFEENNTHGFDNRKGEKHVTGVYRWVDKVYENQIVNYGKRLMYEFAIPEPSRFLKEALLNGSESDTNELGLIIPEEPKHPQSYVTQRDVLFTAKYLTKENYQMFASRYNAEVNAYPEDYSIGESLTIDIPDRAKKYASAEGSIDIPEGYICKSASTTGQMMFHLGRPEWPKIITTIGDVSYEHNCGIRGNSDRGADLIRTRSAYHSLSKNYSSSIPIAAFFSDTEQEAHANFVANLTLSQAGKEQWQNETYNVIMSAYYDRLNEYNDFMRTEQSFGEDGETTRMKFNPATNRIMERRELKRCAIELLTKDTNIELAKDRYSLDENSIPQIVANPQLTKDASAIKFFEQAFDWEIMAYVLYPYYYTDKKSWESFIREPENGDPIFQSFMQSGMARVVVPVREGFESAVNWYQATGEIWEGQGIVTDINDELYLSVAEELTEPLGKPIGNPWKTQVPTSLTIVQEGSAKLSETGLPCDPNCGEPNNIGGTDWVISGDVGSNAADGVGADIVGTDNNVA